MSWSQRFQAQSAARQVAILAGVAMLLCAALAGTWLLVGRKPYGVLFSNLRTADAATIVAELDKRKTPYRLADHGETILAPRDSIDGLRLEIMSQDLPLKGMVGFELFNKSDMGLTEFAQKINYQRALQGELARTLMTMDAIDTARVHLTLPESTVFRGDRRPPKASVALTARPGQSLTPATVAGVQRLVAAAVEDLSPADVVVLDASGAVVSNDAATATAVTTGVEASLTERLNLAVAALVPTDQFSVTVLSARPDPSASGTPHGVRVDVVLAGAEVAGLRDPVQRLVEQTINADPERGDLVTVTLVPGPLQAVAADPVADPVLPAAPRAVLPPTASAKAPAPVAAWPATWVWFVILAALLAAAVAMHRLRPRAPRLSTEERCAFAERLQVLLDDKGGELAPDRL